MPDSAPGTEVLNLSQEFPAVPTAAWEKVIAKDLKGADYDKKLVWRTEEGSGRPALLSERKSRRSGRPALACAAQAAAGKSVADGEAASGRDSRGPAA